MKQLKVVLATVTASLGLFVTQANAESSLEVAKPTATNTLDNISTKEDTANRINELLLTKLLDHERVCSICGKKLPWDCASDKCRVCREMIHGLRAERYKKPVFRGRRDRRRFR